MAKQSLHQNPKDWQQVTVWLKKLRQISKARGRSQKPEQPHRLQESISSDSNDRRLDVSIGAVTYSVAVSVPSSPLKY